ncbi:hydroxymethylbilane synthase [Inediibacterium massiliense]|uniref:hydroxymethylbilane synthase n=1 Tax=Inediibacterium massiliense TaxID=1658111 RepID=UPI0006B59A44|nr:hydroxymethylbilane synthase [Inediibacterium massiliense]
MKKRIVIGSRASDLALKQTYWIVECLKEKFPDLEYEVVKIKTMGDKILDQTLNKIGGKGLFVKEIEAALIENKIDLAVHSMKDVPNQMIDELIIGAVTDREDPRDVLISKNHIQLDQLKQGARIGTSSLRRAAQILAYRPDLVIEPIRGNIKTRIEKMETMKLDGIILAAAGIIRMGWEDKITEYISTEISTPAVGQGTLAIQIRKDDQWIQSIVKALNNKEVQMSISAERSFMKKLNGGCHVPMGAYAKVDGEKIHMTTVVASEDGKKIIKLENSCRKWDAEQLGVQMAQETLKMGGQDILKNL